MQQWIDRRETKGNLQVAQALIWGNPVTLQESGELTGLKATLLSQTETFASMIRRRHHENSRKTTERDRVTRVLGKWLVSELPTERRIITKAFVGSSHGYYPLTKYPALCPFQNPRPVAGKLEFGARVTHVKTSEARAEELTRGWNRMPFGYSICQIRKL